MKLYPFTKSFNLFVAVVTTIFFLTACNKDLTLNPDGNSVGTLKNTTTGVCLPVNINGIYKVDSILTKDNYVDIQVNVIIAGNFNIKSDTVNGYSFKKLGTVGTGLNTIRLYASGKPINTGSNTFTINYGLTNCSFTITVFDAGAGTSLYTLGGSPGNCSTSSINGNYVVGQATTAVNSVEMTVNVTAIGTYIITGTVVNGVSFNASGVFTNPGIQSIFLTATGIPTTAGLFNYVVTNATTTCNFSITYTVTITNAIFSLSGAPNNCTGAVVSGIYTAGIALTTTNMAIINVNVTSPGIYTIATTTVNGIRFSAYGTFNITGLQQINLIGTGTPTIAGIFNLPVIGNGNTCSISVICN